MKNLLVLMIASSLTTTASAITEENRPNQVKEQATEKTDNKAMVSRAMNDLFVKRDLTALDRYWTDNYIQHNPTFANGKTPLKAFIKDLPSNFKYEAGPAISTGNYVMIQGRYTGLGQTPFVVVDIFRIENGKMAEHWDVMQPEVSADKTPNGNSMFPVDQPKADSKDNKSLVENYLTDLFVKKDAKLAANYWGTDMKQHNPTMPNGLDVLRGFAANIPTGFKYVPGIAVAEGNTVMIHGYYEGWGPKPLVAVDIFRIENGKVVEHWDVMQEAVPADKTANGNSMLTKK